MKSKKSHINSSRRRSNEIRFVYFDVGGVLLRWYHVLEDFARQYDKPLSDVKSAFDEPDDLSCRGRIDASEMGKRIFDTLKIPQGKRIDFAGFVMENFSAIPQTHEFLKKVKQKYRVGLLTNIHVGFYDLCMSHGHLPNIAYDAVVESCVEHTVKPEEKIYQIAQLRAGVPHENILFIDDFKHNIEAAKKMGWHTVHFDPQEPEKGIADIEKMLGM
jgi:putative hydrolase of the HAD superfamily